MSQSTFFDQYPRFRQDNAAPILDEFRRLSQTQKWGNKFPQWRVKRKECLLAEFELHFGSVESNNKLVGWQGLCQELRIHGNLPSIKKCKKALKQVHVNLLDFIDDRRAHRQPHIFRSARELADYTVDYNRRFPLKDAKEDSLIKILLRRIDQ
ncbi:MAG: hypothetical protein Q9166_000003 [cf. Caloplaca sp. 2 TL-2023]